MDNFSDHDYDTLNSKLSAKKAYKYDDVKDKLVKVAFDIVKFKDEDASIDGLWQIQSTDDGEVIVAMYEDVGAKLEAKSSWSAITDKVGSVVNVFYKNDSVCKFATKELEIGAKNVVKYLADSLATNSTLRESMLNKFLTKDERDEFLAKYPELK